MTTKKTSPKLASAEEIRKTTRKIVETPEGNFLIRKLRAIDFVRASAGLPEPITINMQAEKREAIVKEALTNPEQMLSLRDALLERCVISPGIVAEGKTPKDDEVCVEELSQETLDTLSMAINKFTDLTADVALPPEGSDAEKSERLPSEQSID